MCIFNNNNSDIDKIYIASSLAKFHKRYIIVYSTDDTEGGVGAMKLVQLEYLIALKQYGSVSQAAEHLYVTQPTISLAVKELEEELGYPLVIRSNRGIAFTKRGEGVLSKAKHVLKSVDDIKRIEPGSDSDLSGTITAACTAPFCNTIMLNMLSALRQNYPEIQMSIVGGTSQENLRMVQQGDCQLGVIHLEDVNSSEFYAQVKKKELFYGTLFTDPLVILAREGHPLTKKAVVARSDLLDYPLVTPSKNVNPSLCKYYEDAGKGAQVISIGDIFALRRFAFLDDPIIISPLRSAIASNKLFQGQLVQLHMEGAMPLCTVCWIHTKNIDAVTEKALEILIHSTNEELS